MRCSGTVQYERFTDERSRPFRELVGRIGADEPRHVVDLGCGPGTLTALLTQRWPGALVEGVDSSPDMVAVARDVPGIAVRLARSPSGCPTPDAYARLILAAGWQDDVWRTTYVHVLTGDDPVLQWVRGTGLRPYPQALSPPDAALFQDEYASRLREAYPTVAGCTLLRFPRTFAVAHNPEA